MFGIEAIRINVLSFEFAKTLDIISPLKYLGP